MALAEVRRLTGRILEAVEALTMASLRFAANGSVAGQRRADGLAGACASPGGAAANPAQPAALAATGVRHSQPRPVDLAGWRAGHVGADPLLRPGGSVDSRCGTSAPAAVMLMLLPVTAVRNSSRPRLRVRSGCWAVTVAVRGMRRSSAISPKQSPAVREGLGRLE